MEKGFQVFTAKGFHMRFQNGWTISVQFGRGNYCDHHSELVKSDTFREWSAWHSETAEIAAWDFNGNWHNFGDDIVKGYATPDEVAIFINEIAAKPNLGLTMS